MCLVRLGALPASLAGLFSLSCSPAGPFPLLVFPHVNVQAVLLGKGGVTLVTLVGLLPCVQPLVDLQVVGHREALPALDAHVRTLSRMALLMLC